VTLVRLPRSRQCRSGFCGDAAAAPSLYGKLAAQWKNADEGFRDLEEVQVAGVRHSR
jgi:hypothetical protein